MFLFEYLELHTPNLLLNCRTKIRLHTDKWRLMHLTTELSCYYFSGTLEWFEVNGFNRI